MIEPPNAADWRALTPRSSRPELRSPRTRAVEKLTLCHNIGAYNNLKRQVGHSLNSSLASISLEPPSNAEVVRQIENLEPNVAAASRLFDEDEVNEKDFGPSRTELEFQWRARAKFPTLLRKDALRCSCSARPAWPLLAVWRRDGFAQVLLVKTDSGLLASK